MADPRTDTRFTPTAAEGLRQAIADAGGVEVFAIGELDALGRVADIEVHCRGNRGAVPALLRKPRPGQVVIHNHPSGVLEASPADLHLAGVYGDDGVGMVITDNALRRALWVVEPQRPPRRVRVDEAGVRAFFEERLPAVLPGWEARPGQVEMALAVLDALHEGRPGAPLVAALEAGTGTGKSLAYLVPAALWAEANDSRVAIATYTITLQGQLAAADLPLLQRAGVALPWAVLQGRSNYVCRRRLAEALEELDEDAPLDRPSDETGDADATAAPPTAPSAVDAAEEAAIRAVAAWAEQARRGSRSELGVPVPENAWERIRSDHDQTLRARCPHYARCLYYEARRDAARARIVVVNQHLLLADLLVKRQTGGDGILPRFDRVIVDEAHHLEDAATGLLASELSELSLTRAIAPLLPRRRGRRPGALGRIEQHYAPALDPPEAARLRRETATLSAALQTLRDMIPDELEALRWALDETEASRGQPLRVTTTLRRRPLWTERIAPVIIDLAQRLEAASAGLLRLEQRLQDLPEDVLLTRAQPLLDLRRARTRIAAKAAVAASLCQHDDEQVQWIAPGHGRSLAARLAAAPIEVGPTLRTHLFDALETTVLTSATLTVRGSFDHLLGRLGATPGERASLRTRTAVFPSPFDYASQAVLALPRDFPPPDSPRFGPWSRRFVVRALEASGGGAFVLCTSHAMVADLHAEAQRALGHRMLLLRQGQSGQRHLLARFRQRQDAVLFGTDSFWEGVSVAGPALRLVVIPRLPFRVPTEPVQEARYERLQQQGLDPFRAFALPQAVLRLRQGFGRLVRSRTDRGAVVVLDRRVHERWYGRVFLASLPPARRVTGPARAVLDELSRFFDAGSAPTPPDTLPSSPESP